ncbi:putative quinol monooxygenase [Elioraea rosea]|uniref:putative quinol monooxygenase n=1 Tax=Elioraea rosea TaxID=2492390 RepID=UPI0011862A75|nr:putative quinol monooxygenase [Elioraea rosea]
MTDASQIHVLARISLKPGARAAWLEAFRRVQKDVLAEDGCLAYDATVDEPGVLGAQVLAGPDTVVIVERWRDAAALRAHSVAPHMGPYREAVKPHVESVVIEVLKAL